MPYASKRQAAYFHAAAERGEMSEKMVKSWDNATKKQGRFTKLPGTAHEGKGKHMEHKAGGKHSEKHRYDGDGVVPTSAPGSHDESHKKLGGARAKIHEGLPHELEAFHGSHKNPKMTGEDGQE